MFGLIPLRMIDLAGRGRLQPSHKSLSPDMRGQRSRSGRGHQDKTESPCVSSTDGYPGLREEGIHGIFTVLSLYTLVLFKRLVNSIMIWV